MSHRYWTDERVELLKKLWGEGLSASQIANELPGDITRNGVIGKVHRLGLSGRVKITSQPRAPRPKAAKPPRNMPSLDFRSPATIATGITAIARESIAQEAEESPVPAADVTPDVATTPEVVVALSPHGCSIIGLTEKSCRWPVGEPGTESFHFCGDTAGTGLPYCGHHARIAYQPVNDRRRDRRLAYL